jgi:uncharacterized membrane protein YgdD (TMEM256/DUF423 family)
MTPYAPLLFFAAIHGLIGVGMGAFAAHAMAGAAPAALGWLDTGARYQLIHAAVLVAVSLHAPAGPLRWAGWAFALGAILFSGSLYAMAFGAPRWLGAVTPVGGFLLLGGWALLGIRALAASRGS